MTAPALMREADMMRAVRVAKKAGATRVTIIDGPLRIDIVLREDGNGADKTDLRTQEQPEEPPPEAETIW